MFARLCVTTAICIAIASPAAAEDFLVKTQAEYFDAAKNVQAGDAIILADGTWSDFEIVLTGEGTSAEPITLRAETSGQVKVTGQSNLRIAGEYLVVKGLTFVDGFTPTGEVVSFRRSKSDLANNSRITEVVIDGFSKADRYETDYWVGMYGKNNRFDHNYLAGKTNKGVTMAVRLTTAESRENNHRIDHNYFGPRPILGSNGGETLRVGTSHYAAFNSNTLIENNYFERANGEVEIISIKAGGNVARGNVFDSSRGALTLRHGDGNVIERNVFLGRGKDHTGGIRVINADQTVRDNYMEGLRGDGFASALTVMNGVPNSPANRYVQVSNATIERNTIVDSKRVGFGIGADEERSAFPIDTSFSGNLLSGTDKATFMEADDEVSGITFADNRLISGEVAKELSTLQPVATDLQRAENGLLYPTDPALANVGAPRDLNPVKRDATGPAWYPKPSASAVFGTGAVIRVEAGEDTLEAALAGAKAGDTLKLSAGDYVVSKTIILDFPLTVSGPDGEGEAATIGFARPSLFEMAEGGSLRLEKLAITGRDSPDNVGNNVIRTTSYPIRGNFVIELDKVSIKDLTVNRNFDVIVIGKSAFADTITIANSTFNDVSGVILKANAETEDYGQYGAEYVTITNSVFTDIGKGVADIYRGGRDESTFGPHFKLKSSVFTNVGSKNAPAVLLHGVQRTEISGNNFDASGALKINHTVGTPKTAIFGNNFVENTGGIEAEELNYPGKPRLILGSEALGMNTITIYTDDLPEDEK